MLCYLYEAYYGEEVHVDFNDFFKLLKKLQSESNVNIHTEFVMKDDEIIVNFKDEINEIIGFVIFV